MFGNRRKRSSSTSSFNANVNNASSSAALAASQAFLKNKSSNTSLAAAAAGAALRSRPTTPTSVADVQTRRTQRRGSVSSVGSAAPGSPFNRPSSQLERRGSSGSMTERTFRSPSPNRGAAVPSAVDAPPVPAIPKNLTVKSQRMRASSVEAPPVRVLSPPPKANGRGSSLGPAGGAPMTQRQNGRTPTLSSVSEGYDLERSESRGSVNFSLPTGRRAMSPYGQRKLTSPTPSSISQRVTSPTPKQNLVYDPHTRTMRPESEVRPPSRMLSPASKGKMVYDANTRSFRPEAEVLFLQQEVLNASQKPVATKKKVSSQPLPGSHLSQGSMDGRPKGTYIDAKESQPQRVKSPPPVKKVATQPPPASKEEPVRVPAASTPKKKMKKVVVDEPEEPAQSNVGSDSEASDRPQTFNTRPGAILVKRPSTIRERDEEEEAAIDSSRKAALKKLEAPAPLQRISSDRPTSPLPRSMAGKTQTRTASTATESRQPLSLPTTQPAAVQKVSTGLAASTKPARMASVSPSRKAHFSLIPTERATLTVRHDPPARSISPRKSALKHSPSRTASPAGSMVKSTVAETSETSTTTTNADVVSEVTPVAKRKSTRVSFDDDRNMVLGRAAGQEFTDSPVIASPQHKKGWFSMGRKKKDTAAGDEDEDAMSPRPALPSFGSIRDKKTKEDTPEEERPLRLPNGPNTNALVAATVASASAVANVPTAPLFTTANGEAVHYPSGTSNDHGVGAIIAQDSGTKHAANMSKVREPLPTGSATTSGYDSEASSVYEAEPAENGISRSDSVKRGPDDGHADMYRSLAGNADNTEYTSQLSPSTLQALAQMGAANNDRTSALPLDAEDHVPEFSFTEPTPLLETTEFETTDIEAAAGKSAATNHVGTDHSVARDLGISVSDSESDGYAEGHHVSQPIMEESESEQELYTDAAESPSDQEGDGFMSLNAIADSPLRPPLAPAFTPAMPDSPTSRVVKERAYKRNQLTRQASEPDIDAGWEKAQQYWSGLTQDKKRQLELQALADMKQENDEDYDEDDVFTKPKVLPYTKTTVSVEPPVVLPPSPKKAVMERSAVENRPVAAAPPPVRRADTDSSERVYQIKQGQKAMSVHGDSSVPKMRTSMRSGSVGAHDEGHMRTSLRDGSVGKTMRTSMRNSTSAEKKAARPVSSPQETAEEKHKREVQQHVQNLSAASAAIATTAANTKRNSMSSSTTMPSLQRRGSDASDSSFKRTKHTAGGFKRGSMRNPSASRDANLDNGTSSSRFSVRTLSPTGSAFRKPFGATNREMSREDVGVTPPTTMTKTMRNRAYSNESNTPTLRSNAGNNRGDSNGRTFGGFAGRKAAPKSSRFAADSDDEGPAPTSSSKFRSRFGDSSDEDDGPVSTTRTPRLRTMRAQASNSRAAARPLIHSRQSSNVSAITTTTASDMSDGEPSGYGGGKSKASGLSSRTSVDQDNLPSTSTAPGLSRSGSGRDTIGQFQSSERPQSPTMRNQHTRRSSILSVFRKKRPEDDLNRVRKSQAESPARRDTPLERSRPELEAVRRQDSGSSNRPKLQKRNTGSHTTSAINGNGNASGKEILNMSSDWPLSEGPKLGSMVGLDGRPFTSDGTQAATDGFVGRPGGMSRRHTADSQLVSGKTGAEVKKKKKKFAMLRRAFGLDL